MADPLRELSVELIRLKGSGLGRVAAGRGLALRARDSTLCAYFSIAQNCIFLITSDQAGGGIHAHQSTRLVLSLDISLDAHEG